MAIIAPNGEILRKPEEASETTSDIHTFQPPNEIDRTTLIGALVNAEQKNKEAKRGLEQITKGNNSAREKGENGEEGPEI